MLNIRNLFNPCKHVYVTFDKREIKVYDGDGGGNYPIYTKIIFLQECKKCGKIRKQKIKT